MPWYAYLAHFVGGAALANGVPHFVHGVCGEKFQSPFAKPPGKGLSPPVTNLVWGFVNFVAGYLLIMAWTTAEPRDMGDLTAIALGALAMGLMLAHHFGNVKGNNG